MEGRQICGEMNGRQKLVFAVGYADSSGAGTGVPGDPRLSFVVGAGGASLLIYVIAEQITEGQRAFLASAASIAFLSE